MKSPKIELNGKEVSSEEIEAKKNFDNFHKQYTSVTQPFYKQNWFYATSGIATAVVVIAGVFMVNMVNDIEKEMSELTEWEIKNAVTSNHETDFIDPPSDVLQVSWMKASVDNAKGANLQFEDGTKIEIQPQSFINAEGQVVSGEVEFKYRKFNDQVDIMMSGIPMVYDSAGTQYQFESAGMLEVRAYQNGEEVQVDSTKKMKVDMESDYAETDYNLYFLNEHKRKWECKGKDSVTAASKTNKKPVMTKKIMVAEVEKEKVEKAIVAFKKTKPRAPKIPDPTKYQFDLDFDEAEFPELKGYENTIFQIAEGEEFDPKNAQKQWNSISIKKGDEAGLYFVTFKNKKSEVSYKVEPTFEAETYKKAFADFKVKHDEFLAKLNILEAEKSEKMNELAKLKSEMSTNAIEQAIPTRTRRSFTVSTGIHNCDRPFVDLRKIEETNPEAIFTVRSMDKDVEAKEFFHIDRNRNTVYRLNLQSGDKLFVEKDGTHYFVYIADDTFKIANWSDLKLDKDKRLVDLTFTNGGAVPTDIDEFKELLKS